MLIQDVKFEPSFTKEELEAAKNFLLTKKKDFGIIANFARILKGGNVQDYSRSHCHARIGDNSATDIVLVSTEISKRALGKSVTKGFLSWLLNDSPFGRFIVNRDDFEFCQDYGLIVSADIPQPILQAIMIISRHPHECSAQAFEKFDELVSKDINSNLAFIVCFCSTWSTSVKINHIVGSKGAHRAFHILPLDDLKNFVSGELGGGYSDTYYNAKGNHYRHHQSIYGVYKLFAQRDRGTTWRHKGESFVYNLLTDDKKFKEILSNHRKSKVKSDVYKPPNPFEQKPLGSTRQPQAHEVTYEELFEIVVPYVNELITT